MSQNSDKATQKQIDTVTKQTANLFKSTASTLIELAGNFPLLNAMGRGDVPTAQKLVAEAIAKKQAEIAAYKATKGVKNTGVVKALTA